MSKGRKKKGNNNINPIVHEQSINASDEDKERNEILDKLKTMRTLDHSPKNITPNIKKIEKLLSKRMKIYITDGRIIIGDFECLDNEGNIILTGTSQYYSEPRDGMCFFIIFLTHSPLY